MPSEITTFFSAMKIDNDAGADILETRAIAEYERDRKRAHKGGDRKVAQHTYTHTHTPSNYKSVKAPAWKRTGGEAKERRVSSGLRKDLLLEDATDDEDEDQWLEEPVGADGKEIKENRLHQNSVRLEDLVVKFVGKPGKKSTSLITRTSPPLTVESPPLNVNPLTALLPPLMDTVSCVTADDSCCYDDLYFEFSSPGSDDWMVTVTADGCLRYTVGPATPATTVLVMPCNW